MNEFNLMDGFENYIVAKIFDAPSNDKKVWKKKKKKYIYIYIYVRTRFATNRNSVGFARKKAQTI